MKIATIRIHCRECGTTFAVRNEIVIKKMKGSIIDDFEITGTCRTCTISERAQAHQEEVQLDINDLLKQFGMT